MAISTYNTFLMVKGDSGNTYSKVVDIKEFPDLGGDPETLETTTMTDAMQTFIMGLQSNEAMEFTANYTLTDYQTVAALSGLQKDYAVWFGADDNINKTDADPTAATAGNMGKFKFSGQLSVRVNGASVNEVVEMTISIIPNSSITFEAA